MREREKERGRVTAFVPPRRLTRTSLANQRALGMLAASNHLCTPQPQQRFLILSRCLPPPREHLRLRTTVLFHLSEPCAQVGARNRTSPGVVCCLNHRLSPASLLVEAKFSNQKI